MNQTGENSKKLSFGLDFGSFGPNLGSKNFFRWFYVYKVLEIVGRYHCMIFQGKLINQTWENSKKPTIPDKIVGTKWSNPVKMDRKKKVWYLFLHVF